MTVTPMCPYCGKMAVLHESSAHIYGGRNFGPVWHCAPCKAWVGCHPGRKRVPLGRLANAELRKAKMAAHAAFDRLWKAKMRREGIPKKRARSSGYKWLADQLGIPMPECHIGMFDTHLCARVVEACKPFHRSQPTVTEHARAIDLEALIGKLEQATGPDRELDALIAIRSGGTHRSKRGRYGRSKGREWLVESHGGVETWADAPPAYTASLDSALTLVPEGDYDQTWTKSTRGKDTWEHWTLYQVRICLETVADDPDETSPEAIGCHNVQAIALCIAALKSHTSMESNHE